MERKMAAGRGIGRVHLGPSKESHGDFLQVTLEWACVAVLSGSDVRWSSCDFSMTCTQILLYVKRMVRLAVGMAKSFIASLLLVFLPICYGQTDPQPQQIHLSSTGKGRNDRKEVNEGKWEIENSPMYASGHAWFGKQIVKEIQSDRSIESISWYKQEFDIEKLLLLFGDMSGQFCEKSTLFSQLALSYIIRTFLKCSYRM